MRLLSCFGKVQGGSGERDVQVLTMLSSPRNFGQCEAKEKMKLKKNPANIQRNADLNTQKSNKHTAWSWDTREETFLPDSQVFYVPPCGKSNKTKQKNIWGVGGRRVF